MTWYTAYYGSWCEPSGVVRLQGTYNRKKILAEAQETADRLGVTVTVNCERPTGRGIAHEFIEVAPKE